MDEREAGLRSLFVDWFSAECGMIDEYGSWRDYPDFLDKAESRAAVLGIAWTRTDAPGWLLELLESLKEDE